MGRLGWLNAIKQVEFPSVTNALDLSPVTKKHLNMTHVTIISIVHVVIDVARNSFAYRVENWDLHWVSEEMLRRRQSVLDL